MTPLPAAPTRDRYEDTHLLMDVVDELRHAQIDTDRLMGETQSDEALIATVRETYASQGMVVSEDTVRQGLQSMKEKRFEFVPPRKSLALRLAKAYVSRSVWGPKLAFRSAVVSAASALAMGAVVSIGAIRHSMWEGHAENSLKTEQLVRGSQGDLLAKVKNAPLTPKPVGENVRKARLALGESERLLTTLPVLPADEDARDALYDRNTQLAGELLKQREALLGKAEVHLKQATAAVAEVAAIQIAFRDADVFEQAVPDHLAALRDRQRLAFQAAADQGNAQGMKAAVAIFEQAVGLEGQRVTMEKQVAQLSGPQESALQTQLATAKGALTAGNVAAASTLIADLSTKLQILPLSYTLRVVSEQGERSGVWRYYNGSRDARSYYIIVDAIDASGSPVKLPIENVEDKTRHMVSRFGVRVPQDVYERVGRDKQDNGIVDNDTFGQKVAGELDTSYKFETLGGMITSW